MLKKMVRLLRLKTLLSVAVFIILCVIFYYALLDSLEKHKDAPNILVEVQKSRQKAAPLSPKDQIMKDNYERSVQWSFLSKEEKYEKLLENPVYKQFRINKPKSKKKVNLLIIVSSGPRRSDRRKAIRETWWQQCKTTFGVVVDCIFFSDNKKPGEKYYEAMKNESQIFNDMYFQPLHGGIEFGIRFLYHMIWAMTHYEFDYFMRLDDDYFFCLERFLYELPLPMLKEFHWGYTHCIEQIVRPEESMILFSRDVVENYAFQKPHIMRCHPWADQMIGVWTTDLGISQLFRHDLRIHHAPVVDKKPELRQRENICDSSIGTHGTYPNDMYLFWSKRGNGPPKNITTSKQRDDLLGNLDTNSDICELVHNFNYLVFEPEWQYEPQRCIYNPVWDTRKQAVVGGVYSGRQDDLRLSLQDLKQGNNNRDDRIMV